MYITVDPPVVGGAKYGTPGVLSKRPARGAE